MNPNFLSIVNNSKKIENYQLENQKNSAESNHFAKNDIVKQVILAKQTKIFDSQKYLVIVYNLEKKITQIT